MADEQCVVFGTPDPRRIRIIVEEMKPNCKEVVVVRGHWDVMLSWRACDRVVKRIKQGLATLAPPEKQEGGGDGK